MFNTLKLDRETMSIHELRRASDPISARSSQHQACNNCHVKKLKCSGEKSGCGRCTASKIPCEYTRSSSRRGGKKSSGRSSTDSRGGDTTGGESSPGSQSGTSSRHKSSRHSKHSTGKSKSHSSKELREEDEDEYHRRPPTSAALDQPDPTLLSPDGDFDLCSLSIGGSSDAAVFTGSSYGGSVSAFSHGEQRDYYGQQHQQAAEDWHTASQPSYAATSGGVDPSYMGTAGPEYGTAGYYANFDYSNYQQQQQDEQDPRYWGNQPQ